MTPCPGCGLELPEEEGSTHRYLGSSPACWRLFGEVLAREYSDVRYQAFHRLTVDAYAVQHPGQESPQTIQSAAVHLISLYMVLEQDWPPQRVTAALQQVAQRKTQFRWMDPPASLGSVTVADVAAAATFEAHEAAVRRWCAAVWEAWAPHHPTVRGWADLS